MIEADIVFGYLIDDASRELQPVMAHPPTTTSDISLKSFLNQILMFNERSLKENQKGVKLDFKSIEVFQNSLPLLKELWSTMKYPVWINADIFSGPLENTATTPVDADAFFDGIKDLPNAVLSIGWTTRWGSNFTNGSYTENQVDTMIAGIRRNGIFNNPLTFPVRAGIAAQSIEQLDRLYKTLTESHSIDVTFTLWSSANDAVNIENLREMIFHFGLDRVYIDVPDELSNQLRLDIEPSGSGVFLKSNLVMSLMAFLALFFLFL